MVLCLGHGLPKPNNCLWSFLCWWTCLRYLCTWWSGEILYNRPWSVPGFILVLQEAGNLEAAASGHLSIDDAMLFLGWWFSCLHSPDMTPCMSPLPHDSPLIEKPGLGQIQEESEGAGFKALPGKGLNICKAFASSPSIPRPVILLLTLPWCVNGFSKDLIFWSLLTFT